MSGDHVQRHTVDSSIQRICPSQPRHTLDVLTKESGPLWLFELPVYSPDVGMDSGEY